MKHSIYLALIGSLALAVSTQAANEKKPQKKAHAGHGAAQVQKAPGKAGGPAHANVHHNSNAMNVQKKGGNPNRYNTAVVHQNRNTAVVHQNKTYHNGAAAVRHGNVNAAAVQHNVAKNQYRNANIARSQNAAISRQLNEQNVNVNRYRNVAVTNNWRGSQYSGQQYSAFRNYRREYHDRNWYTSRYPQIVLFGGGYYYWNSGYWYPAWGYNSGYNYGYDGPIYGYNNLAPGQVVVNVQTQLQQEGYYDGAIDGLLGPQTRRAIAAFQADRGLAITSAIDQPTLATLGLS